MTTESALTATSPPSRPLCGTSVAHLWHICGTSVAHEPNHRMIRTRRVRLSRRTTGFAATSPSKRIDSSIGCGGSPDGSSPADSITFANVTENREQQKYIHLY